MVSGASGSLDSSSDQSTFRGAADVTAQRIAA